jgi:hypothetical protein
VDYHYVLHNELSRGSNDPACFTIRFFGYGSKDTFRADIVCSAFESMERQYAEIQQERDIFARENSLAAKIEASEVSSLHATLPSSFYPPLLSPLLSPLLWLLRKRTQLSE